MANKDNFNKTPRGVQIINDANKRGFFGVGIYYPKMEPNIGTLMRSAYCFGASFVFTIGRRYKRQPSDTVRSTRHIPLYNYIDLEDFRHTGIPDNCQVVGAELVDDSQMVGEFEHPERCIYLLGAEDIGLNEDAKSLCHKIVEVPSLHCLNVSVTGSIIMADRIRSLTFP